ncbi:DUF6221 family protein [Pseudonocardia asaccharolytica]|uniref:Uncharacterized protein n=1 Tax=Pseudonocardia asaccharolytica DSM 44247 = NBRC 16224 TaxID=1123024 RepID=A0A511CYP1_9PSEU|nr:DUF6221 family protein [Pseudonocardia asaccharolytica]GEL17672.1 hypothetical protein PA7_15090 [Pseudonocardia asaccharolytica DSM 44247 = NBRC 16224]
MSAEMIEFLRARLDEDERLVRAATPGPWRWTSPTGADFPQGDVSLVADQGQWRSCQYYCSWPAGSDEDRGTQGTPGHEHRETETVVDAWGYDAWGITVGDADAAHIVRWDPARVLREIEAKRQLIDWLEEEWAIPIAAMQSMLRALALPYADHPDYRPEWRP